MDHFTSDEKSPRPETLVFLQAFARAYNPPRQAEPGTCFNPPQPAEC